MESKIKCKCGARVDAEEYISCGGQCLCCETQEQDVKMSTMFDDISDEAELEQYRTERWL